VPVAYYPADYQKWKEAARDALAYEGAPLQGPLRVSIACQVERPKTTKLPAPKPDIDNYVKSVLDAMTQAGVWDDDSQVEHISAAKGWGDSGCIHIVVEPLAVGWWASFCASIRRIAQGTL
jgi:crossover junction endodeoxyribonuclease RusA